MKYGQMTINQIGSGANTAEDTIYFDGTNFVGAQGEQKITKPGTLTRDMTAASGDVAYTGFGFKPSAIMCVGGVVHPSAATGLSVGMAVSSSSTRSGSFATNDGQAADSWDGGGGAFVRMLEASGVSQSALISTFDSDGFTLTWTKAGSPSAGTLQLHILAFR